MDRDRRNIGVLAICQGLLLTNNSVLITVNALAGYALAPDKGLATLPLTTYFLGSAFSTMPMSLLMKRVGRRAGFTVGAWCAVLGSLICGWAVYSGDFLVLCAGTFVLGMYFAAGQYYRFAAADAAPVELRSRAISLVLAGGILGGFLGPETSKLTRGLFADQVFLGPFLSLIAFAVLSMVVLRWLDLPGVPEADRKARGRPLGRIARDPAFVVAVLTAMTAYGIMNLLMAATPLAMAACEHPFSDAAFVIQWHIVGMFAPSFFTGHLIHRYGLMRIMQTGVALNLLCIAIALAGVEVAHFWVALLLLGVGWNFMFIGATALLTECHAPSERAKVQGINDAAISATMVATSLGAGALFSYQGWQTMNVLAVPFLLGTGAALLWLSRRRARGAAAGET